MHHDLDLRKQSSRPLFMLYVLDHF